VNSGFSSPVVPVGVETDASLSATAVAPTVPPYCNIDSVPQWYWQVDGPDGISVTGNGPSASVSTANVTTSGTFSVSVTATATWQSTCNPGHGYTASASATIPLTVVAVVSITPLGEVSSKSIGDTLTQDDFDITTDPPGYDNMVTVDIPGAIQVGDNYVTATCGSSSAMTDVTAQVLSGSLSDLIIGPDDGDDSMNFTAEDDGFNGTYSVTGDDVDGGDTSGTDPANVDYSSSFSVSATPPSDGGGSRLPTFQNGSLVYGLGGIPGSAEMKQVNGITLNVTGALQVNITSGVYQYTRLFSWADPTITPKAQDNLSITAKSGSRSWVASRYGRAFVEQGACLK
jgi:hypothetical protein